MAPSFCIDLGAGERRQLLAIARRSIAAGEQRDAAPELETRAWSDGLSARRGVFVTLTQHGNLRGCIGAMESSETLVRAVAESAYGAAFRDPRFPQLAPEELEYTHIEISILSEMVPLEADNRAQLLNALQPTLDGLMLQDRHHRSTFLPKVWDQLPNPEQFLDQLLAKAGLPADHWSATLRCFRYRTLCFSDGDPTEPAST